MINVTHTCTHTRTHTHARTRTHMHPYILHWSYQKPHPWRTWFCVLQHPLIPCNSSPKDTTSWNFPHPHWKISWFCPMEIFFGDHTVEMSWVKLLHQVQDAFTAVRIFSLRLLYSLAHRPLLQYSMSFRCRGGIIDTLFRTDSWPLSVGSGNWTEMLARQALHHVNYLSLQHPEPTLLLAFSDTSVSIRISLPALNMAHLFLYSYTKISFLSSLMQWNSCPIPAIYCM